MDLKIKRKRSRCGPNKKWSEEEVNKLLEFLKNNTPIEKPTAQHYYKKFLSESKMSSSDWNIVRFKVKYLRTSYSKAKIWQQSTGAGTMTDGESVKDVIFKMCPRYDDLADIFERDRPLTVITVNSADDSSMQYFDLDDPTLNSTFICDEIPTRLQNTETTVEDSIENVISSDLDNSSSSGNCQQIQKKGIYSRTGLNQILDFQTELTYFKKQQLDFDKTRFREENSFREKELEIKEKQLEYEKDKTAKAMDFEREKLSNELIFKNRESDRACKALELERERVSNELLIKKLELEMKERVALKELEFKYKNDI